MGIFVAGYLPLRVGAGARTPQRTPRSWTGPWYWLTWGRGALRWPVSWPEGRTVVIVGTQSCQGGTWQRVLKQVLPAGDTPVWKFKGILPRGRGLMAGVKCRRVMEEAPAMGRPSSRGGARDGRSPTPPWRRGSLAPAPVRLREKKGTPQP